MSAPKHVSNKTRVLNIEICAKHPHAQHTYKVSSIRKKETEIVRARRAVPDFCPYRTVSNSDTSSHRRHNGFQSQSELNRACRAVTTLGQLNTSARVAKMARRLAAGLTTVAGEPDLLP